jgi:hypothetical protein
LKRRAAFQEKESGTFFMRKKGVGGGILVLNPIRRRIAGTFLFTGHLAVKRLVKRKKRVKRGEGG